MIMTKIKKTNLPMPNLKTKNNSTYFFALESYCE